MSLTDLAIAIGVIWAAELVAFPVLALYISRRDRRDQEQ
jgi:hypothetical protein